MGLINQAHTITTQSPRERENNLILRGSFSIVPKQRAEGRKRREKGRWKKDDRRRKRQETNEKEIGRADRSEASLSLSLL